MVAPAVPRHRLDVASPRRSGSRPQTCWTGTPVERYTSSYSPAFPAWRVDRYAAAAAAHAQPGHAVTRGRPSASASRRRSAGCRSSVPTARSTRAARSAAPGIPAEASKLDSTTALPSNTTYARHGSRRHRLRALRRARQHRQRLARLLEHRAVHARRDPDHGDLVRRDRGGLPAADVPVGQDATDAAHGVPADRALHARRSLIPSAVGDNDHAVSGELWWSASNWRNRISVPITMAHVAGRLRRRALRAPRSTSTAPSRSSRPPAPWIPKFCLDAGAVPVKHVQTGEPQARNLLGSSSIEAAFTSRAREGGYPRPTVARAGGRHRLLDLLHDRRRARRPVRPAQADAAPARQAADRVLPGDPRHQGRLPGALAQPARHVARPRVHRAQPGNQEGRLRGHQRVDALRDLERHRRDVRAHVVHRRRRRGARVARRRRRTRGA